MGDDEDAWSQGAGGSVATPAGSAVGAGAGALGWKGVALLPTLVCWGLQARVPRFLRVLFVGTGGGRASRTGWVAC